MTRKKLLLMGSAVASMCVPAAWGQTVYSSEPAEVVWACNSVDTYNQVSSVVPADGFSVTSFDSGDLEVTGSAKRTADDLIPDVVFVKFKPSGDTQAITLYVKPSKGLTFTPTGVSMYIQRFGTDAQDGVVVTAKNADGSVAEVLGTYTAPRANHDTSTDKYASNDNWTNQVVIEMTADQQAKFASEEGFYITATVGVNSNKEGGFSDIHITGLIDGTREEVAKYTLSAVADPAQAGTVTLNPAAEEYEVGTEVTVSVEKNFGYQFENWTEADGTVVSENEKFTYVVEKDAVLTANFNVLNTYNLALAVDGGANDYMVTTSPAGTTVDGKLMFEEGTAVKLTASSNPILTFTNWSDGQSSSEITVNIDSDKSYTASYSAIDFIVGWDFYLSGSNGRTADFASEDNDAAQLVLRKEDGTTSSWLDKSEEAAGGYEGRPGAVNWKTDGLGAYYWQTRVNAEAFTDISVLGAMVYNYNAYTTYDLQASIDGENWETVGEIVMSGAKNWSDYEITLPKTYDNQPVLYLRWIADQESAIAGTESNNDGATMGATYILGTAALVNDGTAPVLVSAIPEEGSNTASINGKIVLTFDEKVVVAEDAAASLGSLTLTPTVSGTTVIFPYKNLAYATEYTFCLPANSVSDRTENYYDSDIIINFTTKTRPAVAKALYDFVVPADGTMAEAIAAANSRSDKNVRYRIFVKKGTYALPLSESNTITSDDGNAYPSPITNITGAKISFIGEDRDETIITNLPDGSPTFAGTYGTTSVYDGIGKSDVLQLQSSATENYFQDITIKSGIDDALGRNLAVQDKADRTIYANVCLYGYQDTWTSNNSSARYYFEGGVLRGRTDYLCGKGDAYFNGVTLQNAGTGGYIAVPSVPRMYGYIFKDCEIVGESTSNSGNYTLGRPWGQGTPIAVYIDTKMTSQPSAIGWSEMSNGYPKRFAEYNSTTAAGTQIDLSGRKTDFNGMTGVNDPALTQDEAENYFTYANAMGGDDDWDPASDAEQAPAPTNVVIEDLLLSWDNSDYASLWVICFDGHAEIFTIEPQFDLSMLNYVGTEEVSVRAANEMGGLGEAVVAVTKTPDSLSSVASNGTVVKTTYYNTQGQIVTSAAKGIVIRIDTLSDGTTRATKLAK